MTYDHKRNESELSEAEDNLKLLIASHAKGRLSTVRVTVACAEHGDTVAEFDAPAGVLLEVARAGVTSARIVNKLFDALGGLDTAKSES